MATTQSIIGINELRAFGDEPTPMGRAFEVTVQINGTYLTAGKPTYNFLTGLIAQHMGAKSVVVLSTQILRDRYDGTNRYTASVALSNSIAGNTNDLATLTINSGGTHNGAGSTEVADATNVAGQYTFLVVAEIVAE
jgi:hypothetical protein